MTIQNLLRGVLALSFIIGGAVQATVEAAEPKVVSVQKIWDGGKHNAFTDLIRFGERWLCCFREAEGHGASIGNVRIIESADGAQWQSLALIKQQDIDLRDPKLSIMPDGRLMLIMGGIRNAEDGAYLTRSPRVSFSADGVEWTTPRQLLAEDHWLWRVTWRDGWAYSVSKLGEGRNPRRGILYRSRDGLKWDWVTEFQLPNNTWNASETTLRFADDGSMIALTRPHWIGVSQAPYTKWSWKKLEYNIGGPNFIQLPNGEWWASARGYAGKTTTVLARMSPTSYRPVLSLPSGGDTSYPGMVWHEDHLWLSYYSSHEGKTCIYLAKVAFADADQDRRRKPAERGFQSMFDGKTLKGWSAYPENTKGDWYVEDGAIIGAGSANRQSYMVWRERKLTNFELRFQYKMLTDGNTGVEIHAQPDKTGKRPFEGYHADLGHVGIGDNILGAWDFHFAKRKEHPCPRGTRLVIDENEKGNPSAIDNPVQLTEIRRCDWNDVRVVARGNRFQFYINDKLASEFTDNAKAGQLTNGAIGLQIHDKGMRVAFRNLRIEKR